MDAVNAVDAVDAVDNGARWLLIYVTNYLTFTHLPKIPMFLRYLHLKEAHEAQVEFRALG